MNSTQKWIEAGKILATDPTALISCPVCGKSDLSVHDFRAEEAPSVVERVMTCQICGAYNSLRLIRPIDGTQP